MAKFCCRPLTAYPSSEFGFVKIRYGATVVEEVKNKTIVQNTVVSVHVRVKTRGRVDEMTVSVAKSVQVV